MTASLDRPGVCEDCGSPRECGQRYCLGCGARVGPRSPLLERLLTTPQPEPAAAARLDVPKPGPALPFGLVLPAGLMRLPSARVSATLVLMFLGFGVIVGDVAGSPAGYTLAASSRGPVRLILPSTGSSGAGNNPTPESSRSSTNEPPSSGSEPTPSPGASSSSSSSSSSSTSGSSGSKPGKSSSPSSSGGGNGGSGGGSGPSAPASSGKLPPIKHVFVVMLSDQPYASVFGPSSPSPYLSQTLERRGELLVRYYAVAHQQLANEIALISGQGPTPETAANCPVYGDITPATAGAQGQVTGRGCIYPSTTGTLAGQLTAKHLTWRAYLQGMDEGAGAHTGADGACGHPAPGAADPSSAATPPATPPAGQAYATSRNPFVYFRSVIDASACATDDVGLSRLGSDLASAHNTPSFSYIAPDPCHDGSPTPCAPGAPAGLPAAEGFLKQVVGEITASPAYKQNGLLAITVDEAPSSGEFADSSSCCGQPQFPNLPPSTSGPGPEGGGQVGALLLSPFIHSGVSQEPYNHFSLLRTIEDIFGLSHLGYAALSKVPSFEPSIFSSAG